MARKPKLKNQAAHNAPNVNAKDMTFWRGVARDMMPANLREDQNAVNELAVLQQQTAMKLASHFPKASEICDESTEKSISLSLSITLDRVNTPSEVTTKIKYNQQYGDKSEVRVPDPTQTELPLESEETGKDDKTPGNQE